jgi:5'-methylthioadenosine phosphorylase
VGETIGVIGGTGLDEFEGFKVMEKRRVSTPFGNPSDELTIGEYNGVACIFLPRHGAGHRIPPGGIRFRANIWALKSLGVKRILSVSAVGSLKLEIEPRHFVLPNQFYDNTRHRASTFFDLGPVTHVVMADPYCPELRGHLAAACRECGVPVHEGGTYINMEGPQFSTRGESRVYRQLGFDVIGMTSATEAKLAREAEICYATVALVTDYDVWHEEDVTIEIVLETMAANVANVKAVLAAALPKVAAQPACKCQDALNGAIVTDLQLVAPDVLENLRPLLARYM